MVGMAQVTHCLFSFSVTCFAHEDISGLSLDAVELVYLRVL